MQKNGSKYQITRDGFTNLRDKKYLLLRLDEKMQEAIENNRSIKIAMFDMDNFKSINEILSYKIGDIFIKEISKTIQKNARKNNIGSYRFGGEEFILISNSKNKDEMIKMCSDIQDDLLKNETLNSYTMEYKKRLEERLKELKCVDIYAKKNQELKSTIKTLYDLEDIDDNIAQNDNFKEYLKQKELELKSLYKVVLSISIKEEEDESIKQKLEEKYYAINKESGITSQSNEIYDNKKLDEYLSAKFNKSAEIHQIKKWLDSFNKNEKFSITCAIKEIKPNQIADYTPENAVEATGELLKQGKWKEKGNPYYSI